MTTPDKEIIYAKKEEINNYEVSIQAIQSFISLITWDDEKKSIYNDSHYSVGRKMTPYNGDLEPSESENNVTPDIVLQKGENGYVVEVKRTITKETEHWDEIINQLRKYSRPLIGWWTDNQKIKNHCSVFLLGIAHSYEFLKYIEENNITFDNEFSIVDFAKEDGINEFIFFRRYYGTILNDELNEYLSRGSKMPIERIVGSYGEMKFYDAEPSVIEYMMSVLWQNVFNRMKADEGVFNESTLRWEFNVSIDEIMVELQKSYGRVSIDSRDVSFPKKSWVKKALDCYVDIDFAEELSNKMYKIFFRKLRGDVNEEFIKRIIKLDENEREKDKTGQLELFG